MKRLFDIFSSALGLLLFLPAVCVVAMLIRWKMGGPILFRQERSGMHGKPFQMIKFRTMMDAVNSDGNPLPDEQRLTRLGNFLRLSSLDELPSLLSVLKGDMSLVGPRPLLVDYLPLYSAEQLRRHEVRPGITGWAQVNGRNTISWEKKFEFDVWYVDNQSFWLDLKILFLTVWKVLRRDGISQEGNATMSRFLGSEVGTSNGQDLEVPGKL